MAFTPHYLIQPYQGLESFYQNGLPLPKFLQDVAKNLSSYFAQMSNMSKTYGQANSAGTCGTVYVTRDKAQQYANELRELISPELKANMLAQNPRAQLYGECGGQDCVEFILNTVLEYPVCNGDRYVNPYLAIAIGMTETGGLQGTDPTGQGRNLGFHFGCSPIAFSSYNENAMQTVCSRSRTPRPMKSIPSWFGTMKPATPGGCEGGGAPLWSKVRQNKLLRMAWLVW